MPQLLADIAPGAEIRITGYAAESAYTAQLRRLGLVPGTLVKIIRRAPLGDPLEVRVRGYSLALRPSEACDLQFEVVQA